MPSNNQVMEQRVQYGVLAIAVSVAIVGLDGWISDICGWPAPWGSLIRRGNVLPIASAGLLMVAARELVRLMVRAGYSPLPCWSVGGCGLLMVTPWLASGLGFGGIPTSNRSLLWSMVVLLTCFIGSACSLVLRRRPNGSLASLGSTWIIISYMGLFPSFIIHLRSDPDLPGILGAWVFLFVILVVKAADMGAYFAGSWFGRHKLLPQVSPAKTVEGAAGAILASVGASLLLTNLPTVFEDYGLRTNFLSPIKAVQIGVVLSFAAQMGDLLESLFKRDANLKDSAPLIPNVGGILDVVDSPVLAIPVAWFFLAVWWEVV